MAVDRRTVFACAVRHRREFRPAALGPEIADHAGTDNDDRKGHVEKEDRHERDRRQSYHDPIAQRPFSDADHGLNDDREHRGFQSKEQRLDEADLAIGGVDVAQAHNGDDAGQNEQAARHNAAGSSVQQPADIGGKLLRLGPWQQHAVVEGVQEPLFRDPAFLLDQNAVHHRDLSGGAAEAERRDAHPRPERLAHGDAMRWHICNVAGHSRIVHLTALTC